MNLLLARTRVDALNALCKRNLDQKEWKCVGAFSALVEGPIDDAIIITPTHLSNLEKRKLIIYTNHIIENIRGTLQFSVA